MIEDKLKKWIEDEIEDGVSSAECFSRALIDDNHAKSIWSEFASWHREDLVQTVQTQIRGILKKQQHNP